MAVLIALTPLRAATIAQVVHETTPLEFVQRYINGLSDFEDIRDQDVKDQKANPRDLMRCVRSTEAWQLQLSGDIASLNSTRLKANGVVRDIPRSFVPLFEAKRNIYSATSGICSAMVAGPRPGVDYGAMVAAMPKLSAQLDYIDKSLFDDSPC